ncbi:alpha/beta hydrolase [Singulisphaera rosea]
MTATEKPQVPAGWFSRRRLARRLVLAGVVGSLAWFSISLAVAYKLTRRPQPPFAEGVVDVPWGTLVSERLKTRDGHEIGAWYHEGREGLPTILLLHGNGGSRKNSLERAEVLASRGYSVLLISLRAHGDSTGDFNDIGYGARLDVLAAVESLERRHPGRPIIVHGTSLGAAAAVFASTELGHRVRGYILESPYQDLKVAVWNRTENALPPVLDWLAYRGLLAATSLILPYVDEISPVERISGIPKDVPVLIIAGGADKLARPSEAQALLNRVKSHGTLVTFEKAGHLKFLKTEPERYRRTIFDFLEPLSGALTSGR